MLNNIVSSTASQSSSRISAAISDLFGKSTFGTVQKIGKTNIYAIFEKAENLTTEYGQNYAEQKGIGTKPTVVYLNGELKKYSLTIKLHASYCDPDYIIKALENKAKLREIFSFYYKTSYIGEFFIESVQSSKIDCINGITVYGEITVRLTEYYDGETDYTQQTVSGTNLDDLEDYVESTSKAAVTVSSTSSNIFSRLTTTVINDMTRTGESYINSTIGGLY